MTRGQFNSGYIGLDAFVYGMVNKPRDLTRLFCQGCSQHPPSHPNLAQMVLPTHSNGVPVLSSQFAFLAIQRLTCRPRARKAHQEPSPVSVGTKPPPELPLPIPRPPPAYLPVPRSPHPEFRPIQSLTSRPTRKARSTTTLKPSLPRVEIEQTFFLPSELLHIIFTFALEPSSYDIDLEEKTTLRVTILSCAQVCQQWRLAARDCRVLWPNAVDFQWQSPEVIADLLQLSRPHPIDVGHRSAPLRIADQRDLAILDLLATESRRIREWNVELPSPTLQLRARQGRAFPSTDQPLVTAVRYTGRFTQPLWDLPTLTRTLRKLSIRDASTVHPLQDTLLFSALTELRVSSISPGAMPLEAEWFGILRNMPQLKLLALHDAVRLDLNAPPLLDFWLPQLQFLSLESGDWVGACANLKILRHLQVPDTCGTELGFPSASVSERQSSSIRRILEVYRGFIRERIGGFTAMNNFTTADTPQLEISVRPTPNGCQLTFGTVRHPDLTLNWNGDHGTSGVTEYLDIHAQMFPKFPPLSVTFNNAAIADINHAFELTCDIFWKVGSVKIHVEADASFNPFVGRIASSLPSLLSRFPQINVLKLDKGSSTILKGLFILVPSVGRSPRSKPNAAGLVPINVPVLRNLRRVVLEMVDETTGRGGDSEEGSYSDAASKGVQKYAAWRQSCGHPIEVVRR